MQYESRDMSGGCRMGIISLTGVSNPAKVTISISSDFDHTCYKMLTTVNHDPFSLSVETASFNTQLLWRRKMINSANLLLTQIFFFLLDTAWPHPHVSYTRVFAPKEVGSRSSENLPEAAQSGRAEGG